VAITRRQLFSGAAKVSVPAAIAVTVGTDILRAGEPIPVPNAAVGLLYDATICIGCKACVAACAEANDTPPDTRGDALHQAPSDLNDLTRNIIKLYKPEDGSAFSFVKRQCMHCLDPACAAGCPFQALHKDPESGVVNWSAEECIGCRYCTITCPYHIPRFQWVGFNPRVTKCELCSHRLAKGLSHTRPAGSYLSLSFTHHGRILRD
jgi:Fe-S-cluster-containing dehydrogenase component